MEIIITFIKPGDAAYADIFDLPAIPRVGEMINIGDFDHEWWRVGEVVYTVRREDRPDGPPVALVVEHIEDPNCAARRRKSETRDG